MMTLKLIMKSEVVIKITMCSIELGSNIIGDRK